MAANERESAFCLDITSLTREQAEQLSAEDKAAVIAWSDQRDQELQRRLQAEETAYRCGREAGWHNGYTQGYDTAEADHAADWQIIKRHLTEPSPILNPDGYARHVEREAERTVRRAETAGKRDQADHEREFVARAYATPPHLRNAVQEATIYAYPPPGRRPRPSREYARPAPVVPLRGR